MITYEFLDLIDHFTPYIKLMFYGVIFLICIDMLLVASIRYLVKETDRLYVELELLKRGHVNHTQDELDRFIEEYKEGLK